MITISLIVFLPLVGGLVNLIPGVHSRFATLFFTGASFAASILGLVGFDEAVQAKWNWVTDFAVGIQYDRPAAILLALVSLISLLIHLYSAKYMEEDAGKRRYFAKLGFFTFSMLGLLIADDLISLFIFWELVGISSYLLIGFWYQKHQVSHAARTAFMVNRLADVALLAGILVLYAQEDTLFISQLDAGLLFLPSILIAIGAFGKSAQLPFSGWLIKAMVGPTPVSALIHAATMVAAGVYLLFRLGPFFDDSVLTIMAVVGMSTALYGAIAAITQNDIKKVLAYSTISQLGYMVMGIGVGAGEASLFHLWTHAFFKAGLFLGAGVVIHHIHKLNTGQEEAIDAQDIRLMGGLYHKIPWTFVAFLICGLSLAGIPLFSGFMSKEGILLASWSWADQYGTWAYLVPDIALITILITAFYIGRLTILVFLGESRWSALSGSGKLIEGIEFKGSLTLLALGSLWLVYNLDPFEHRSYLDTFLGENAIKSDSFIATYSVIIAVLLSVGGLLLAFTLFRPGSSFSKAYGTSESIRTFGGKAIENGLYLTSLYQLVGTGTFVLARLMVSIERGIDIVIHAIAIGSVVFAKVLAIIERLFVDGLVNLVASTTGLFGRITAGAHSREIQWQIIWLLIACILIIGLLVLV